MGEVGFGGMGLVRPWGYWFVRAQAGCSHASAGSILFYYVFAMDLECVQKNCRTSFF